MTLDTHIPSVCNRPLLWNAARAGMLI
jgi:hypothetical protein